MVWKGLFFATVLLVLIFGCGMAYAYSGPVFFMKANSTAKIYTEFNFSKAGDWNLFPTTYLYPLLYNDLVESKLITVMVEPNSFTTNKHNLNVTYTIITKKDSKGTFEIFTGVWGYSYPLVVGLNESEVNPEIFHNFQPVDCTLCPGSFSNPPKINLVSYSGLIPKTIPWKYSGPPLPPEPLPIPNYPLTVPLSKIYGAGNYQQSSTTPEFPFVTVVLTLSIVSIILLSQFKFIVRR